MAAIAALLQRVTEGFAASVASCYALLDTRRRNRTCFC